ncbi:MAG: NAD-dependent epimerase/dehydratase family protein [Lentisphaeria bacterium]|jgi:nucleoside-diphosphate-sugar epimerase|nr:NAD-dependent epimerase/dehydratase family protein [Lentisphaeria bacterium]
MPESILVTGGLGFLGSNLVQELLRQGYRVRIFAREPRRPHPDGAEVLWGDIRDREAVSRAARGVDRIVHTVSNFRHGGSDAAEAAAINVGGTENVMQAAREHGVRQLLHCSTIGVHGSVLEIPANETTPFNPGDLYQSTKLEAERRVRRFAAETGLPVTVIRPISLFGPGDMRMLKLFRMIQRGRFVVVGDGRPYFQPAYIDDVVAGFLLCLRHPAALNDVFIIGGDTYVPLNELFQLIAQELQVPPPRLRLPLAPVLAAAGWCEKLFAVIGREPPLHRRRVSFFQNNRAFSIAKARTVLGFEPRVSLVEAIRRTAQWYRGNGYL